MVNLWIIYGWWLVVWNMTCIVPYIGDVIIPIDELICLEWDETTNQIKIVNLTSKSDHATWCNICNHQKCVIFTYLGVPESWRYSDRWMVYFMENPFANGWWLGVPSFMEPPIYVNQHHPRLRWAMTSPLYMREGESCPSNQKRFDYVRLF